MKLLEERIKKEGKVLPGDVLKVYSFLNHQVDPYIMDEIGKEFYRLFKDAKPNKILTIESSGIAIALACARYFDGIPLVYAKKNHALNMDGNKYEAVAKSYTRSLNHRVAVAKEFLNENDRILILDDFLANGEASQALISICEQAKALIVGVGIVVSKSYQPGEKRILEKGLKLEILANIKSLKDGIIEFYE